jgi:acylaminoacyl-peptidase
MARRLELDDLDKFIMLSDPQLSPDSQKLSFVVTRCVNDNYYSNIWIVDSNNGYPIRYYTDGSPFNARWSPNGQQILFTSKRKMESNKKGTGIWITQVWGGEPRRICKVNTGINDPKWNKYGTKIYFISSIGEANENIKLVDQIPIWSNDEGRIYYNTKQLSVVDVNSGIISQLTKSEDNVQCYDNGNQGGKIAYAKSANTLNPNESELYIFDIAKGKHEKILCGYWIFALCWSPNDDQIAFLGHDGSYGYTTHWELFLVSPKSGEVTHLTEEIDLGCSRSHNYDLRSPYTSISKPKWEGKEIYFPVSESNRFGISRIHIEHGHIDPIINGQFSIEEFSVSKQKIAYTKTSTTKPIEIWVKEDETEGCITRFNDHLIANLATSKPEKFEFKQKDKEALEGWILKPHGWKKGQTYPAILDIRGGPRNKFGDSYMFEHQLFTAKGYGVIYINNRGSKGYSQEFADIRGESVVWDLEDLKKGVNIALKQYSWIDKERLGINGLGYGGFITNWIISRSNTFKTAVSQNSISNWTAFFGTSDIGFHYAVDQIGGSPWSNKDDYIEKSPIFYAGDVNTPVLFIHSWNDYKYRIDQSIQFFTALKYLGKDTQMVLFLNGTHDFSCTAKPNVRKKRLEIILNWFDKYLKN